MNDLAREIDDAIHTVLAKNGIAAKYTVRLDLMGDVVEITGAVLSGAEEEEPDTEEISKTAK